MLILGAMWGLSFSLSKLVVTGGIEPIAYVWMQSTGAALFLFCVCRVMRIPVPLSRRHLIFYAAAGLCGLVLPNLNIVNTARHLPAGILSTVVTTVPLMTYLGVLVLGLERFSPRRAGGIALGLAGVLFIVLPETSLPDPAQAPWVLVALITPALYASANVISGRLRPDGTHSLAAALGMVASASLASLPVMLVTGDFHLLFGGGATTADLAMVGQIAVAALAYIFYFEIIRRAGPVYTSQVGYVVTVLGLGWGYLIFDEIPSLWVIGAVACVFAGVALVNRTPPAKRS